MRYRPSWVSTRMIKALAVRVSPCNGMSKAAGGHIVRNADHVQRTCVFVPPRLKSGLLRACHAASSVFRQGLSSRLRPDTRTIIQLFL